MNEISSVDDSCDTPLLLKNLKLKNILVNLNKIQLCENLTTFKLL